MSTDQNKIIAREFFMEQDRRKGPLSPELVAFDHPARVGYVDIWRLENGKVAENWVQMDMMDLLQQLGVIPRPQAA
jgi:hypothetical protein